MNNQQRLQEAAGAAPFALLHCYQCSNTFASSYEQDFRHSWSLRLKCSKCWGQWWVCTVCSSMRMHLKTSSQVSRHHRLKHKQEEAVRTEVSPATLPANEPQTESQLTIRTEHFSRDRCKSVVFSS